MPKSKNHTHLYGKRSIYSGKQTVWACGFPNCSHYMPCGTSDEMLVGKFTKCWECLKEFTLTYEHLMYDHPCCSDQCKEKHELVMALTRVETIQNDPFIQASNQRLASLEARSQQQSNIPMPNTKCPKCGGEKNPTLPYCVMCQIRMIPNR